jgi:hypothetical protein
MHTIVHISFHVKYQLFLTILSRTALVKELFPFVKFPNNIVQESPFSSSPVVTCIQLDRASLKSASK